MDLQNFYRMSVRKYITKVDNAILVDLLISLCIMVIAQNHSLQSPILNRRNKYYYKIKPI